jgi:GntR family transcriptional regulator of gluconate operon
VRSRVPTRLRPIDAARSLAQEAADGIRDEIFAGGFRQGDRLVEARLAEQLKISRGPVREALKLLRAEGLVSEEPRRGTFVVILSAHDVRETYGLRAALESGAARLLARRKDPAVVERLRELLAQMDAAALLGDATAVSRADLAFHEGVCELCGNTRIHDVFVRYVPTLLALLRLDERVLRSLDEFPLQHTPFVDAIEVGDEELAARLLTEHAEQAGALIADLVAGEP